MYKNLNILQEKEIYFLKIMKGTNYNKKETYFSTLLERNKIFPKPLIKQIYGHLIIFLKMSILPENQIRRYNRNSIFSHEKIFIIWKNYHDFSNLCMAKANKVAPMVSDTSTINRKKGRFPTIWLII